MIEPMITEDSPITPRLFKGPRFRFFVIRWSSLLRGVCFYRLLPASLTQSWARELSDSDSWLESSMESRVRQLDNPTPGCPGLA